MKKGYLVSLLVIGIFVSLIFLNGCFLEELFNGTPEDADLVVVSVEPLKSGGELTGIRVEFNNSGGSDVAKVKFAIVFSDDETISIATDTVVYEDNISLDAGKNKQVDVAGSDVEAWMASHNVELTGSTYFLGAYIDPDDEISEGDETNNEEASSVSFDFGDGGGNGSATEGTLTMELTGAGDLNGATLAFGVFHKNAEPESGDEPLAAGTDVISNGGAQAEAKEVIFYDNETGDFTTGDTWTAEIDSQYDIWMMIDIDGDLIFDPDDYGYDYTPLTVIIDSQDTVVTVDRGDFSLSEPDESLTIELSGASSESGAEIIFYVFNEGDDRSVDPILAEGFGQVESDGTASIMAMEYADVVPWTGNEGQIYDIYYLIDNDSSDGGSSGDYGEFLSFMWNGGNQQESIDFVDMDYINNTLFVDLANAIGLNGEMFAFGVLAVGGDPGIDPWLAGGGEPIAADGSAYAVAVSFDTLWPWDSNDGEQFDIHMLIDVNGNEWPDPGEYSGAVLSFTRVGGSSVLVVDFADFDLQEQPVPVGAYSESIEIVFEPGIFDENVVMDTENEDVGALDGVYVLRADFSSGAATTWLHFNYPDDPVVMNISDSTNFIFSIEDSLTPELHSLDIIIGDPDATYSVNMSDYTPGGTGWLTYTIPLADFSGFDTTRLTSFKFGFPRDIGGTRLDSTIFFDEIYFE